MSNRRSVTSFIMERQLASGKFDGEPFVEKILAAAAVLGFRRKIHASPTSLGGTEQRAECRTVLRELVISRQGHAVCVGIGGRLEQKATEILAVVIAVFVVIERPDFFPQLVAKVFGCDVVLTAFWLFILQCWLLLWRVFLFDRDHHLIFFIIIVVVIVVLFVVAVTILREGSNSWTAWLMGIAGMVSGRRQRRSIGVIMMIAL
mmetsp:Transcript_22571/g.63931  ORF Transcript_22571/g.63931 Transcript_22571/m.63931 type:complete len:204 (+) Transcript_22571:4661-5272(+)